jgi:hypothetical protein
MNVFGMIWNYDQFKDWIYKEFTHLKKIILIQQWFKNVMYWNKCKTLKNNKLQKISFKNSFVWKNYFEIKKHVDKINVVGLFLFHLDPTIQNPWCGKMICKKGEGDKNNGKIWHMILMPLFMVVFQFLVELPSFCNEDSIFGAMDSNEDIL